MGERRQRRHNAAADWQIRLARISLTGNRNRIYMPLASIGGDDGQDSGDVVSARPAHFGLRGTAMRPIARGLRGGIMGGK